MEAEAKPFVEKLGLKRVDTVFPAHVPSVLFQGTIKSCTISVVTNGKCPKHGVDNVGTTPAALSTYLSIAALKPDLLINAGTAGGFNRCGGVVGDTYICHSMKHHDRRIPIPGFTEYGRGSHSAHNTPNLVKDLGFKTGVVSTANSLDHTPMDDEIMLENEAAVKDMEAAAVAWVAEQTNTPFVAMKVLTDIVDGEHPTHEEFMANLGMAAEKLQLSLNKVIEYMTNKDKLSDL